MNRDARRQPARAADPLLDEIALAERLRQAGRAREAPPPIFESAWQAAAGRARRRQRRAALAAAVLLAAIATGLLLDAPRPQPDIINIAMLLESTQWQAPSDALLPPPGRDLYEELPTLDVSTDWTGESLL